MATQRYWDGNQWVEVGGGGQFKGTDGNKYILEVKEKFAYKAGLINYNDEFARQFEVITKQANYSITNLTFYPFNIYDTNELYMGINSQFLVIMDMNTFTLLQVEYLGHSNSQTAAGIGHARNFKPNMSGGEVSYFEDNKYLYVYGNSTLTSGNLEAGYSLLVYEKLPTSLKFINKLSNAQYNYGSTSFNKFIMKGDYFGANGASTADNGFLIFKILRDANGVPTSTVYQQNSNAVGTASGSSGVFIYHMIDTPWDDPHFYGVHRNNSGNVLLSKHKFNAVGNVETVAVSSWMGQIVLAGYQYTFQRSFTRNGVTFAYIHILGNNSIHSLVLYNLDTMTWVTSVNVSGLSFMYDYKDNKIVTVQNDNFAAIAQYGDNYVFRLFEYGFVDGSNEMITNTKYVQASNLALGMLSGSTTTKVPGMALSRGYSLPIGDSIFTREDNVIEMTKLLAKFDLADVITGFVRSDA